MSLESFRASCSGCFHCLDKWIFVSFWWIFFNCAWSSFPWMRTVYLLCIGCLVLFTLTKKFYILYRVFSKAWAFAAVCHSQMSYYGNDYDHLGTWPAVTDTLHGLSVLYCTFTMIEAEIWTEEHPSPQNLCSYICITVYGRWWVSIRMKKHAPFKSCKENTLEVDYFEILLLRFVLDM